MKRSHNTKPCMKCPYRPDSDPNRFSLEQVKRMNEAPSHGCHGAQKKECAGHMQLNWYRNVYVRIMRRLELGFSIEAEGLVFRSTEEMEAHYSLSEKRVMRVVQKYDGRTPWPERKVTQKIDKILKAS